MPCADTRLVRIGLMLARRNVQLICAQELLDAKLGEDNYFVSIVEQELCVRSHAFVGLPPIAHVDRHGEGLAIVPQEREQLPIRGALLVGHQVTRRAAPPRGRPS